MHVDFTGKRVLVTGSTAGIGFAAAKGFSNLPAVNSGIGEFSSPLPEI